MRSSFYLNILLGLAFLSSALASPIVDDPLLEGTDAKVAPVVPTGKVLLFPVSAYDAAGQLNYTATSDNPKVLVRVKTGNPLMKFVIQQDASGTDPGFTGTVVFQLFRDLTPDTVGYIGGFSQGGFYETTLGGSIFRLADFGPVTGQARDSYIFQGGSKNGASDGNLGYSFDNEFSSSANFTGSGQIAMANAGYDAKARGTNGSQFFITDGQVRQLDFKHTIFGQATHGFGILHKIRDTPKKDGASDGPPVVPINITSSSTVPQYVDGTKVYTDAVLVLSATAPGTAHITVTATNAQGESDAKTFTVTAQDDARANNSRPFLTQLQDTVVKKGGQANLGFRVIDLERDYVPETQVLAANGSSTSPNGFSGLLGSATEIFGVRTSILAYQAEGIVGVVGNSRVFNSTTLTLGPYTGPLYPTVSITQHEGTNRGAIDGGSRAVDNQSGSTVAAGESGLITEPTVVTGSPGVAPAAAWIVGRYRDTDAHGKAADVTATINWGDGGDLSTGTIATDAAKPASTGYQIAGTHTYARAGTYTVVINLTSTGGLRQLIRSTAIISTSTLKAAGQTLVLPGPTVANGVLATFTDSGSSLPAASYTATVDWGDGTIAPGTVRAAGPGGFAVVGKHSYQNAERFSVSVRVHKSGAAADQDSVAWSTVLLTKFFGTQHLPPFNLAHLSAGVTGVPISLTVANSATKQTKVTVTIPPAVPAGMTPHTQTYFTYSLEIVNSGNLASKPGKLRFYLSLDKTVNLAAVDTNPADIPLQIKDLGTNEFFLPAMAPGQAIQYFFQKSQYADYRLVPPPNETGTGYNFLAQLDYTDPIADHLPIDKVAVAGKISGIFVDKPLLTTRESGTSDTLNLTLDRAPTASVTVPIALENDTSVNGTLEGTLDKTSVVFTPSDYNLPHPVTITGKSDTPATGTTSGADGTKTYQLFIGLSTSTDPFYNGMAGPQVLVANADRDRNLTLTSSATTYTTSEAATNSATHTRTISLTISRLPTAPVSVTIASSDTTAGVITVPGGTDDPADPNKKILTIDVPAMGGAVPFTKTFTITGVDDHKRAGSRPYTVSFTVASNDKEFDGLRLPSLSVTTTDDGDTTGGN